MRGNKVLGGLTYRPLEIGEVIQREDIWGVSEEHDSCSRRPIFIGHKQRDVRERDSGTQYYRLVLDSCLMAMPAETPVDVKTDEVPDSYVEELNVYLPLAVFEELSTLPAHTVLSTYSMVILRNVSRQILRDSKLETWRSENRALASDLSYLSAEFGAENPIDLPTRAKDILKNIFPEFCFE